MTPLERINGMLILANTSHAGGGNAALPIQHVPSRRASNLRNGPQVT
jgi:hypothetical protein